MNVLVIPSCREASLTAFLRAWQHAGDWNEVVLIEDNAHRSFTVSAPWPIHHYSHAEIHERLNADAWIISRRDSACRCFGFLIAKELGAEWILTLDDDCLPAALSPICAAHREAMYFDQCQPTAGRRTRGLPYRNLGTVESRLNMGLWSNVADVDGPQGLSPQPYFKPPRGSHLANPRLRYPLCGMNLFFHTALMPALYFPLMGQGRPYSRFDDIWCGWIFQRVAEHAGIAWSYGEPSIEHARASDPFSNLLKEAPGLPVNETFWQRISGIPLSASDIEGAVAEIAAALREDDDSYLRELGRALNVWLILCAAFSPRRRVLDQPNESNRVAAACSTNRMRATASPPLARPTG